MRTKKNNHKTCSREKNVYSVFHKKKCYKKSSPEPEKKIKNNVQVVCDKQKLDFIGMICVGKHPRPPQDLIFSRFFENMTIALKSRFLCFSPSDFLSPAPLTSLFRP